MKRILLLAVYVLTALAQNPVVRAPDPRGTTGQLLQSNGPASDPSFTDPIISFNYVTMFTNQAATGTATSSAIRLPWFSFYGTLAITGTSITGSPSGCQIELQARTNVGTPASSAVATQAFTPASSYQSFTITPASGFNASDMMIAVYTCSTYPTGGTITVGYNSINATAMAYPLPAGTNNIGDVDVLTLPSVTIGTFPDNEPFNLNQIVGTTVSVGNGVSGTGVQRVTLASDSTGQVTLATGSATIGALTANQSVNINQIAGGAVSTIATGVQEVGISDSTGASFLSAANALNSTGSGLQTAQIIGQFDDTSPTSITENQFGNLRMSANRNLFGTIRDAAGNERGVNVNASNELNVSSAVTSFPDNEPFNVAQINGVTPLMGAGNTGTGSLRTTQATDQAALAAWGHGAVGAAPPAGGTQIVGPGSGATAGFSQPVTICTEYANIDQTSGEQIITGVSGRRIYICSLNLTTATAQNIAVVAGTGTVCATTTVPVPGTSGGSTAATGWNLAANGGMVLGGGIGAIAKTTVNADNLCILQSGSGQVSGGISYAIY